ncbi:MAG: glycoside hydrolase family protein, partial [Pseudogulbenkiania sp.]|nr:glycoside hydrolase family protein [Pseudogulbenkiania sp.]
SPPLAGRARWAPRSRAPGAAAPWWRSAPTLRRRINQRDWESAAQELRRWIYGRGKVLNGLVSRRGAESRLLNSPGIR